MRIRFLSLYWPAFGLPLLGRSVFPATDRALGKGEKATII